jgi:RNA polymerase sigma-70 factor (ECF subfamily)
MSEGRLVRIFPRRDGGAARTAPPRRPSDAELLDRIARGDTAAHRAIFDRYFARVTSFVRRRIGDEGLCEEIVADVFFEVWRGAAAFRGDSEVHSWIFGIAHFKALSARRSRAQLKRARVVATESEALARMQDPADAAELIEAREQVRRLAHALDLLPEGQRDVLRLAFLEGRSYLEIADALGISEGNVKTRVNRARTRLRALLQRREGPGAGSDPAPGRGRGPDRDEGDES